MAKFSTWYFYCGTVTFWLLIWSRGLAKRRGIPFRRLRWPEWLVVLLAWPVCLGVLLVMTWRVFRRTIATGRK